MRLRVHVRNECQIYAKIRPNTYFQRLFSKIKYCPTQIVPLCPFNSVACVMTMLPCGVKYFVYVATFADNLHISSL